MKATDRGSGALQPIKDCWIEIPGFPDLIVMYAIPDIGDSKSAAYNDEPVIGRSFPLKTYSHSENRAISMTIHFLTVRADDVDRNLKQLRAIESAVYPRSRQAGAPFVPPPVCRLKCGKLLGDDPICAVLKNYNVRFPSDVPWDTEKNTYLPYKFDVDTSWEVIYRTSNLPGQQKILDSGG